MRAPRTPGAGRLGRALRALRRPGRALGMGPAARAFGGSQVGRAFGARRRLGFRIALFLGVALLPVGLIAVVQTLKVSRVAQQRSELTLLAFTEHAALAERQQIQRSLGTAQALAGAVPALLASGGCDQAMARLIADGPRYSYAGYVEPSGAMTCSSDGRRFDFSDYPTFRERTENPRPRVVLNRDAPLSRRSVLVASHPVPQRDGGGFAFVSLPHERLGVGELPPDIAGSVELMTFNAEGEVLTSSAGLEGVEDRLPAGAALSDYIGRPADIVTGTDRMGRRRAFAVVPILHGTVHALGSWEDDAVLGGPLGAGVPAWVFPILMWVISLVVAYVAVHRLVIRPMREVSRRMRDFAERRRLPHGPLGARAPAELAEMDAAFAAMAERILREEAETEDRLHEQKVLLREVHHRVKNNLQLISSIINMQIRQIDSAEARQVLRRVQDRVLGLATIHRNLTQTEAGTIRADVVLREIVGQLALMGPAAEGGARVAFDVDPLDLYPDQAVPLSLFVTEATTNAVKYIGRPADGGQPWIAVTLERRDDGPVEVAIANSKGEPLRAPAVGEDGTGLGNQLIRAFAMQLDAAPEIEDAADAYRIAVRFTPTGFEEGRSDAPSEAPAGALEAAE